MQDFVSAYIFTLSTRSKSSIKIIVKYFHLIVIPTKCLLPDISYLKYHWQKFLWFQNFVTVDFDMFQNNFMNRCLSSWQAWVTKYVHGFVVFRFVGVMLYLLTTPFDVFTDSLQNCLLPLGLSYDCISSTNPEKSRTCYVGWAFDQLICVCTR